MKTSNKILLGTLLLVLVIITAIHAAIYAKYKRNDFVTMQVLHKERYDTYKLSGVRSLVLSGLQNVKIIPSDTAKLEVLKVGGREISHDVVNGVLSLNGDTLVEHWNNNLDRERNYRDVIIYLPGIENIQSESCNLQIKGSKDPASAQSLSFDLTNSELHFSFEDGDNSHGVNHFNKITVAKASHSLIELEANVLIKEMNLNMDSSRFEDGAAQVDSISIHADNASTVQLSGKNISKTKFLSQ